MWDMSAPAEKPTPAGLEPSRRRACPATHSMKVLQKSESEAQKPRRKKKRRKGGQKDQRYTLAEAWRVAGLDELEVAKTMADIFDGRTERDDGDKTLLDAVKESIRVLEPSRAMVRTGGSDPPVTVVLEHTVPRPERAPD
jgi:hypothetical protein